MTSPFDVAPDFGKVAFGGEWEKALRVERGQLCSGPEAAVVVGSARELACEAFFGKAFIGVRRHGSPAHLSQCLVAFGRALSDARDGSDYLRRIGVPSLKKFLFAELGAEGAWTSVGALRVDATTDVATVFASSVGVDAVHDKALELTYDIGGGDTCWFAWPVSKDGLLDEVLLAEAVGRIPAT